MGRFKITDIRRYILECNSTIKKDLMWFFSNKRWIKSKDKNIFRVHYTSFYFEVLETDKNIYIDIWGEGPFGIIMPLKNRIIGLFDKIGEKAIIQEFEKYLKDKKIYFTLTTVKKEGKTQYQYIICGLIYLAVLIIVLFFIL
jgi:hypothetical protein